MKLWLLKPHRAYDTMLHENDNSPWEPWYDKAFGFVVRAETEVQARQLAHQQKGDEGDVWLDVTYSSCEELTAKGDAGVVLRNYAGA